MAPTANFLAARPGAAQSIEHEDATSRHKIAKGHLRRAFTSADHGSNSEQPNSEQPKSERSKPEQPESEQSKSEQSKSKLLLRWSCAKDPTRRDLGAADLK